LGKSDPQQPPSTNTALVTHNVVLLPIQTATYRATNAISIMRPIHRLLRSNITSYSESQEHIYFIFNRKKIDVACMRDTTRPTERLAARHEGTWGSRRIALCVLQLGTTCFRAETSCPFQDSSHDSSVVEPIALSQYRLSHLGS